MDRTLRHAALNGVDSLGVMRFYQQRGGYQGRGKQDRSYHGGGGQGGYHQSLPADCIFDDSFYMDGYLRREIFIEAAEKLARLFENAKPKMSQSAIRSFFYMLKQMDLRQRTDKTVTLAEIKEQYYMFVRQCAYQERRIIIPAIFKEFAEKHLDVATSSKEEFHGFVEYLTSIMARMKTK